MSQKENNVILINPEQNSIYMLAHRNPDIPREEATLEDYYLLNSEPDNLKYLFIRPEQQTDEESIQYKVKQIIAGANIYDAGLLGTFISEYLNDDSIEEDENIIPDVTQNIDKLYQDFFVADTYTQALQLRDELLEKQSRYYDALITNGQDVMKPIDIDIVDLVLLIAEFTNRVIIPSTLDNPDRLDDLNNILNELAEKGTKPSYSGGEQ